MKNLLILAIALSSIFATCNKRTDCSQTDYSFEGFFKAYPDRDSIKIGDTIWLETKIPVQIKDRINGEVINYTGALNLGTAIGYGQLLGGNLLNTGGIPAANDFVNILLMGVTVQSLKPDQVREFLFVEEGGFYLFKLAIVAKKQGLFAVSVGNAANVYTKNNKCSKASFDFTFKDTNQHLYLYEQSRPGYFASEYEKTHLYVFKVY